MAPGNSGEEEIYDRPHPPNPIETVVVHALLQTYYYDSDVSLPGQQWIVWTLCAGGPCVLAAEHRPGDAQTPKHPVTEEEQRLFSRPREKREKRESRAPPQA
jgi:hypothetical protein